MPLQLPHAAWLRRNFTLRAAVTLLTTYLFRWRRFPRFAAALRLPPAHTATWLDRADADQEHLGHLATAYAHTGTRCDASRCSPAHATGAAFLHIWLTPACQLPLLPRVAVDNMPRDVHFPLRDATCWKTSCLGSHAFFTALVTHTHRTTPPAHLPAGQNVCAACRAFTAPHHCGGSLPPLSGVDDHGLPVRHSPGPATLPNVIPPATPGRPRACTTCHNRCTHFRARDTAVNLPLTPRALQVVEIRWRMPDGHLRLCCNRRCMPFVRGAAVTACS